MCGCVGVGVGGACVRGCVGAWVRGCVGAWVRGWMRGCVDAWMRGCVRALGREGVNEAGRGGEGGMGAACANETARHFPAELLARSSVSTGPRHDFSTGRMPANVNSPEGWSVEREQERSGSKRRGSARERGERIEDRG